MIKKIVISGGPCSAKTTSLSYLRQKLEEHGFIVYCVPEAATTLILGGMSLANMSPLKAIETQTAIVKLQMAQEEIFMALARQDEDQGKKVVILCDRGILDSKAFVDEQAWQATLDLNHWHEQGILNCYDAVIHLVSVAVDKPEFYTLENNKARSETPEQAAQVDEKLKRAWTGHPHLRVIDNSTDLEGKLKRVLGAIMNVIGDPEPLEYERKYLIGYVDLNELKKQDILMVNSEIAQDYLQDGSRVRRRGSGGRYHYTHTSKGPEISPGKRPEYERTISSREWLDLLRTKDPMRDTVVKIRSCFLYRDQYFELDNFVGHKDPLILLELEIDEEHKPVSLPSWLVGAVEVTGDPQYSNRNLALKEDRYRL